MTLKVVTVNKSLPIKELSKLFIENRFNCITVRDYNDNVIAVVTQGYFIVQKMNIHIPTVIALFDAVLFLDNEKKFQPDVKKLTGTTVEDIYHKRATSVTQYGDQLNHHANS
jgi:predicted transcriptional regulator